MKLKELISNLIEATERAQHIVPKGSLFDGEWAGFKNIDGFGSLNVSREMNRIVGEIAKIFYDGDAGLARTWTRDDWFKTVDKAIIPMIAKCDPEYDRVEITEEIVKNLAVSLEQQKRPNPFSFIFGCYVFATELPMPISFGKVSFWPRSLWLDDQIKRNTISEAVYEGLKRTWQGVERAQGERDHSEDRAVEKSIRGAVGSCNYICEVAMDGHSGASAQSKALMAMRFGLTGIALTWQTPSKALFNMPSLFDGLSRIEENAILASGRIWPGGMRRTAGYGQPLIDVTWDKVEEDFREIFGAVTEIIEYVLDANGSAARPKLMDALAHSMLWFHEACRETLPMVAVAKYVASMDALAAGSGSASGLVKAMTSIFGVDEHRPIRMNGPTFREALIDLYSQGRSRLLHGSSDRLMHDWESSRSLAEAFARQALVMSLDWATNNPGCDNPKALGQR
ncbi:hypothetical protein [Sphingobium baderi]|uniref:hypothetical protein n=1 Tax=Sphingobium baderi TaxID=1332080 RepID=UPI002B4146CD|nr:hypothetical protein [Sphingobium baderi]WRD77193.1 hypothetical protein QQ987_03375 [Sphingobium baderi]